MDDEFDIGASVWDAAPRTSLSIPPPAFSDPSPAPSSAQDAFDDFDDFGTPAETVAASGDEGDDDFGDFGDFGEAEEAGNVTTFDEPETFSESVPTSRVSHQWQPLRLDPSSSREEIRQQVDGILDPLWVDGDSTHFTDDPIRQSEGLNQILVNAESRQMYDLLLPATQPSLKPVNWTRSRIRRQHLITLGIPVNLDEVLPRAGAKLPTLEIHTRPTSAPPAPYTAPVKQTQPASRIGTPRSGTPQPGNRSTALNTAQARLGPQPPLDEAKINSLLEMDPNSLLLLPAAKLSRTLEDLKLQTASTSALLTYLLQMRDALQQDSETYNKLIGELVSEAQKVKTGKKTSNPLRRGSGYT